MAARGNGLRDTGGGSAALWGEHHAAIHAALRFGVLLIAVAVLFHEQGAPLSRLTAHASAPPTSDKSEVLLPTIGIRAPLVSSPSWDDADVRQLLQQGIVALPTEEWKGKNHIVLTAHSSGGTAAGDYRFLFATIHRLAAGDEIRVRRNGKEHIYRVREQRIVAPTAIRELPKGERPTLTLVSCWPLGRNTRRILVVAEEAEASRTSSQH